MTDMTPPERAPEPDSPPLALLTQFAPVPRLQNRRDGWGPDVQRAFIEALADCGCVEQACRFVGRTPTSAYRLRRHPEGAEFAAAWQLAADLGIRLIEDAAIARAAHGVEVPVFYYGDQVATRRVHNESLVMFMLRNRLAGRYTADGARALSAVDRRTLERLKKQWREEWEAERAREEEEEDQEVTAGLVDTFEQMHRRWYGALSPRARAAYRVFRRIEIADSRRGWGEHDPETYDERWPAEYRAALDAEYDEVFAADSRARIWQIIDVDGYGVGEALAAPEAREEDRPLLPDALSPPPEWKVIDGGKAEEGEDDDADET